MKDEHIKFSVDLILMDCRPPFALLFALRWAYVSADVVGAINWCHWSLRSVAFLNGIFERSFAMDDFLLWFCEILLHFVMKEQERLFDFVPHWGDFAITFLLSRLFWPIKRPLLLSLRDEGNPKEKGREEMAEKRRIKS